FFQAEDGIRDFHVTGVQTCALPISTPAPPAGVRRTWGTPHVALGIADVRGIASVPVLGWNGTPSAFEAGAGRAPWIQGIHADVQIGRASCRARGDDAGGGGAQKKRR